MMGRQEAGQAPLFYAFNLEDHVPASHMLRGIDRFLDLGELHQHLAPHYSHTETGVRNRGQCVGQCALSGMGSGSEVSPRFHVGAAI